MAQSRTRQMGAFAAAFAATAVVMLTLDMAWLGIIGRAIYDAALGSLKRREVFWPAALLFYFLYVSATVLYAEFGPGGVRATAMRGAALGLVTYGTYELTNWAVLRDWPPSIVGVDLVWGIALTAVSAAGGRAVFDRLYR